MKFFQIEEPDGAPGDPDAPGAAIGIDAARACGEVAFSVGGNAVALSDRDGFVVDLAVPAIGAPAPQWQAFFEAARLRAERSLGRPVTHAVVALAEAAEPVILGRLNDAAAAAGLALLEVMSAPAVGGAAAPALVAAVRAEDLAPRPEGA